LVIFDKKTIMRYDKIDNTLFKYNRQNLAKLLKPKSVAVFHSSDQYPRNGDQYFKFRQQSDLFYLTGIEQEKTILMLAPGFHNEKFREVLFILKPNPKLEKWEGHKLTVQEARDISGIENVFFLEDYEVTLREVLLDSENIYLNTNEYVKFFTEVPERNLRFAKEMKEKYPLHRYERLAPLMIKLRQIKSEPEVELIRKACKITGKAFDKVLAEIKPGMMEYEVEAIVTGEYIRNGASGHGYDPIVASGFNACMLHYTDNDQECKDGDLVLMDIGAEYANYSADMTRTIPVNGKFTERQKACYNAVLDVFKQAREMLVVGNTIDKVNKAVNKLMEQKMIELGLFTREDVEKQDPDHPLYLKYFMHGISHPLGLDVHDVGSKYDPFKPGMVVTCEPGLYIEEENIGIRIENDILITEEGPVDLMIDIPIEVDEIEAAMRHA
jgi:Xaa-Pro aminopeptidase